MSDTKKTKKDMKFEAALKRLEEIVSKLEEGDIDLEKSIEFFEEGVQMAGLCRKKLDEAEKKIEKLTKDKNGGLTIEPAEDPTGDAPF